MPARRTRGLAAFLALGLAGCGASQGSVPTLDALVTTSPSSSPESPGASAGASATPTVAPVSTEAQAKRLAKAAAPGSKEVSGYRKTTQPIAEIDDPTVTRARKCLKVKPDYLVRGDNTALLKGSHRIVVQANVHASVANAAAHLAALKQRGSTCLEDVARVDRTVVKVDYDSTKLTLAGADAAMGWSSTSSNRAGTKTSFSTEGFLLQAQVGQVVLTVASSSFGSPKVSRSQAVRIAEMAIARLLAAMKA